MKKILAVITARGGSKGLPLKNVLPLAGKPLIVHTIEAALGAKDKLYKVIVSTDDEKIAEASRNAGAEVPFMRPDELATDMAGSLEVVQHAARFVENADSIVLDWVMLLQPTTPLRDANDILASIKLADGTKCDSVVSVAKTTHCHPLFLKTIDENNMMQPYVAGASDNIARQELTPDVYYRNGGIYLVKRDVLLNENSLYGKKSRPYIMSEENSVDIDTIAEFRLAEFLIKNRDKS